MKSIFLKLFLIVILLMALNFFDNYEKKYYETYQSGKEDVYVNVTINSHTQRILLDDYLLGVVAGEMPASYEIEAIKAQVVASRTFVYSRMLNVDNTTASQVYLNEEQMKESWQDHYGEYKEKIKKAIEETKGEIITYRGECISALFFNSSNGKTENVENYFSGDHKDYLVSVDSHWDEEIDSFYMRKKSFSKKQLDEIYGDFQYSHIEYYPSGRVKNIIINQKSYSGRQVRETLQLSSSDFQISKENNQYVFITKGSGHGVGMSQCGAQGMAKEGYHYQEILKHYYQGIDISQNKE